MRTPPARIRLTGAVVVALACGIGPTHARAGDVAAELGATTVGQAATDDDDAEFSASADAVITLPAGPGRLTGYFEGSSTPDDDGVAAAIGEVNDDVGSALDGDGNGRVQLSSLYYTVPAAGGELTVGPVDVTEFLDASDVANDETGQFLGSTFVNNPVIEFPDYTLGAVYGRGADSGLRAALTGSNGLADNPDATYEELVDLGDDDKGVSAAVEGFGRIGQATVRGGAWANTRDHTTLDGAETGESNTGLYGVADLPLARAS